MDEFCGVRFHATDAISRVGKTMAGLAQILTHHRRQPGVVFNHQKVLLHQVMRLGLRQAGLSLGVKMA